MVVIFHHAGDHHGVPFITGGHTTFRPALRLMFEARKRVFVDILKWDVPVLQDRYEIDQFDTTDADYLILTDETEAHIASARLLRTDRAHILGELFTFLCEEALPSGATTREITRFLHRSCAVPEISDA